MRQFVLSLLLAVLPQLANSNGMTMNGCSADAGESVSETTEQTILLFFPWTGSASSEGLLPFIMTNLDDIYAAIKSRGGLRECRLMLFLSETYRKSKLSEVVYDASKMACKTKLIKEFTGQEYTTQEGLKEILNEVKSHAPAQKYALMVGCHGLGWTFKDSWRYYPYYAKAAGWTGMKQEDTGEPIPYANYHGQLTEMHTRFIGSLTDIETYSIDIPTIAQAIAGAGMKMEYVLFDDCYMANVEVAYELRNVTNILLASTSEVMAIGVPYSSMWAHLASGTPSYERAISVFNTFYRSYAMPYGTFSAIDCSKMDELAEAMRHINASNTLTDEELTEIQVLDGFYEPIFYDMGDYLNKFCTDIWDYSQVESILERAVISKCNTDQIYSFLYNTPRYIDVNTFSGITISDPSINSVALDGKEKTAWWKATHDGYTAIKSVKRKEDTPKVFSPEGKQLETTQKGLNIVRMSNGKTKKVVVR